MPNILLSENPLKSEFFLPSVVDKMLKAKLASVRVLETVDKWYGVTYREDLDKVRAALGELCENGMYEF